MPRVSVVVPVYNVEDYLDECLSSLEAQTSGDLEAVCVNDGSTDSSRDILARWERRCPWVRVVDKPNGGLSSARNAGIRAATGELVCFLDSDDRLLPQACERVAAAFCASGADLVVFGGHTLPRDATTKWMENALSPEEASYEGFCEELVFGEKTRPYAWRVAARREFLLGATGRPVLFDEDVRYGEDQVFLFLAYALSPRTKVIGERLYEYRVNRVGSLVTGALRDQVAFLSSSVDIMATVLDDYDGLHLLARCGDAMLAWLARFVALDAFLLGRDECAQVLALLGGLVRTYWTREEIRAARVDAPVRRALLMAVDEARPDGVRRKAMNLALRHCLIWRRR